MRIPDSIKKSVVFIGIDSGAGKVDFKGTGFFVSVPSTRVPKHNLIYLVTAKHVVAEIGNREFCIRANTKDGKSIIFQGDKQIKWWFHPKDEESADVAVLHMFFPKGLAQTLDFSALPIEALLTDEQIKSDGIGDGDDVFITGLFAHHHGSEKNLPIIRTGNIAMMPEEPIPTSKFGNMEVYLIEARSIGGLSGSPVFVLKPNPLEQVRIYLLGLIHGHWDVNPEQIIDAISPDAKIKAGVNVGIAMVMPAKKILETINRKELLDMRSELESDWLSKNSPTAD